MEDIAPKLLEKIQKDFQTMLDKSEIISRLYKKVRDGTATYKEANEYSVEVGHILADVYGNNLSSEVLPDGKMYYNIAKRIISPTMENNYHLITEVTKEVQNSLNSEARIGIKPMIPELNRDRINGIINRLSREAVFDDVKWILEEPIVNFCQSIVDDAIKVNAEFHGKAGMKPKIIRKMAGNCCEWCREVAGTYSYPNVPDDVYRRHQRCRCTVDYFPGNGKVQNVHNKQVRNESIIEQSKKRTQEIIEETKATKFKRTFGAVPQNQVVNVIRKESEEWIKSLSSEEKRCIEKYTLNEGDKHPKFYERLNAMLRGDIQEDDNLRYYAETISTAIKKSNLKNNVIAYRGVNINPIGNAKTGDILRLNQFISTSVVASKSFKANIRIVVYAKKGSKGAYVENISKITKQRELLFDKDCIYRVLSNKGNIVELEVL